MHKTAFLVLPEFSQLGLAAATEPLFIANWLAQKSIFDWRVVSLDGKPVRASNGLSFPVHGDLTAADDAKTVFVLASFEPNRAAAERRVLSWLKRKARLGAEIGGIENGSLVLAAAGLLKGHTAAVHWDNLIGFEEHYPALKAASQLYSRSGARITCAGASAVLDLMLAWMGWHGEADLAAEVAEHLLLAELRVPEAEQRANSARTHQSADRVVAAAEAIMRERIDEPLTCGAIAHKVGVSLRQLERRFLKETACSVLKRYRLIRMNKAHQLLQQTELSVTEVAFACGFASPEYFCRLYRSVFDCSPSKDRRQSTTAPVLRQQQAVRRARKD